MGFYAAQKLNHKKIKRKVAKRAVLFSSCLEISFDILKSRDRLEVLFELRWFRKFNIY
jgi:hypothetical protein